MTAAKKGRPARDTERTLRLREMWIKASREPLVIQTPTPGDAVNLRFTLYNAVKKIRDRPEYNEALAEVLEVVQVKIVDGDAGEKCAVRLGKSAAIEALDRTFELLGITGKEVPKTKDDVDMAADASLARIQAMMRGELP